MSLKNSILKFYLIFESLIIVQIVHLYSFFIFFAIVIRISAEEIKIRIKKMVANHIVLTVINTPPSH